MLWRVPAAVLAEVGERLAGIGLVLLALSAAVVSGFTTTDAHLTATAVLAGAGLALADRRRGPAGLHLATSATAVCAIAAVVGVTSGPLPLGLTLTAVALGAVLVGRSDGSTVTALTATAAPMVASGTPVVAALLGLVGALIVGEGAVRHSRRRATARRERA